MRLFFDGLENYCSLTGPPINYGKIPAFFSARAAHSPAIELKCAEHSIAWASQVKYLGYICTPKLGFSAIIISFRLCGHTSQQRVRKALFMSYAVPLFTWMFPFFPLFTPTRQKNLDEFFMRCRRRISFCLHWHPLFFMYAANEVSLVDRCKRYWEKYPLSWADLTDGHSIVCECILNTQRTLWLQGEMSVRGMHRSTQYKDNISLLEHTAKGPYA